MDRGELLSCRARFIGSEDVIAESQLAINGSINRAKNATALALQNPLPGGLAGLGKR